MTDKVKKEEGELPTQDAPAAFTPAASGRLANGRFDKGFTANRNGRPKKLERAWSNRQLTTDIILEANAEVPVTRDGKVEHVPIHRLIWRRLFTEAAKGEVWAQKMAIDQIYRAQSGRELKDWKFYEDLERQEKQFEEESEIFSEKSAQEVRDKWRKKSRKV